MLFVISGPSGVGKGTIIQYVLKKNPSLALAVSATTRPCRTEEINGQDYYFLNQEQFFTNIKSNAFLEWCQVHQHYYGTLKSEVTQQLKHHQGVIIEIDVNGAQKIKRHQTHPQYHIFIAPPSNEILEKRLKLRNTESNAEIQKRLQTAQNEMTQRHLYDKVILNDELTQTCNELNNVLLNVLTKRSH